MTDCDLIKIIERQAHYESFVAEMESLGYLMELSERDLLVQFQPVIMKESFSAFKDFGQEHRDIYLRLKLNAVIAYIRTIKQQPAGQPAPQMQQ